jgi:RimJ/RimL family protein N-acetyltransferase
MSPPQGRPLLAAVKSSTRRGPVLGLPVGRPIRAFLRPVATSPGSLDDGDVRRLTEWRNRHVDRFLHEFAADEERTARWLQEVIGPDDGRILFMVDDAEGTTIGYMALAFIDWDAGTGEADAIVRGGDAPRGTMALALTTLLHWGRTQLGLSRFGVRVRSDNPALGFYERLGFVEHDRVALRPTEEPDGRRWVEDPGFTGAGPKLVHMTLTEEGEDAR